MNSGVKYGEYKNLGGVFCKDTLIKILSKYKCTFEPSIKGLIKRIDKIIFWGKLKKDLFHVHNTLNHNDIMRFVVASTFAVMLMGLLFISASNAENSPENYVNIQVRTGDTVWTIASRHASDKEDIRELVYAIKTINGLNNNALIYTGQTLKIPTPANASIKVVTNTNR